MKNKKKCQKCENPSVPGLVSGVGLCQYHYNEKMWGKEWADKVDALVKEKYENIKI